MGKPINKPVRGIRDSIPGGYVLGRTGSGKGPPILLPITNFTSPGYVANTTIQVGGAAGGDLSGTYPNPTVAKIQGVAVSNAAPTDGQILEYVSANTDWEPTTPTANPTATGGDVAVNGTAKTFMRSDAAPAIQKASSTQFGIAKVDGTTITSLGGVISSNASVVNIPPGIDQIIDRHVLDLVHGGAGSGAASGGSTWPTAIPASATFPTIINGGAGSPAPSLTALTNGLLFKSGGLIGSNCVRAALKSALSATSFTITMGAFFTIPPGNFRSSGMFVSDGTKYVFLGLFFDTTPQMHVTRFTNSTTFSAHQFSASGVWMNVAFFRIVCDGTHLTCLWSGDGINFVTIYQEAIGAFLGTITTYGIGADAFQSASLTVNDEIPMNVFYWAETSP